MSKAKENSQIASKLLSDVGSIVTADSDSLELLSPGTDGQVLTADSTQPKGIKWDSPAASGLSAGQITDLTDSGDTTLHYHATDRNLTNATGTLTVANGGTASTTAQTAINLLTNVAATVAGNVLTKVGSDAAWATPSGAGIGDVSGPASAVSGNVATYNGTTGKLIADGGVLASDIVTKTGAETLTNKTHSTGSVWNGTIVSALYGGTAQTSWTKGDLLYSSATNTLAKLPVGSANSLMYVSGAGIPAWGNPPQITINNGSLIDRPYENYITTGGTDTWPDNTTPENSLLRIGLGTAAAPRELTVGNAPCGIFMQNYVKPNFGVGSDSAYTVGGANCDTIVTGGIGGVTGVSSTVYKIPGTYTGGTNLHGGRFGVDARDATHYEGILTGLWAYTHGDRFGVGGIAPGIEINAFCNQAWDTTANYSQDPFWTNGKRSVQGLLINNYQHAVYEYGGTAGQYQNTFGIALTSLGPGGIGGRSFGYQTGLYLTDCSKENIRIRGGVIGSTDKSDYGIKFEGNACTIAGIALGPNKFNWGTGSGAGSVSNNGDMLYNESTGILYMNQIGATTEILSSHELVATATDNTVNRKIRVRIAGVNYYLLASTGWS